MKILAYVEYDSETQIVTGIPEKIYYRNITIQQANTFIETAKRLIAIENSKSQIERRDNANTLAEIQRLDTMGFMHISKIDAYFDSKISEVVERTKQYIWLEKQKAKVKSTIIRLIGWVGLKGLKSIKK